MGMSPSSTLTYGYDINAQAVNGDWLDDDEPEEAAGQLLDEANLCGISIWRDYHGCHMRLTAKSLCASGWNDRGETDSLELPADVDGQLRRAAAVLGIDLGEAKLGWVLVGEFN